MSDIEIRGAAESDASRLAYLAGQLGYPCSESAVRARMGRYAGMENQAILVAAQRSEAVGWASLEVVDHFYLDPFVEITGFVVDEAWRSRGIGAVLMAACERWTGIGGYALLRLKTNALRKDAHRFYERLGFEKTKEQYVYAKRLARG